MPFCSCSGFSSIMHGPHRLMALFSSFLSNLQQGISARGSAEGTGFDCALAIAIMQEWHETPRVWSAGSSLCPCCWHRLCSAQLPADISSSACQRSGTGCHCSKLHSRHRLPCQCSKAPSRHRLFLPLHQSLRVSICSDISPALHRRRPPLLALQAQAQAQPLQWQLQWPRPAQPSTPAVAAVGRHQQVPQVQCLSLHSIRKGHLKHCWQLS